MDAAASVDPAAVAGETDEDEEPPERRLFLRGGWSSEEAPVAAAFLLFLSILSPLRTAQQQQPDSGHVAASPHNHQPGSDA